MQILPFFPGCDISRPANSNDVSILIVGEPCVELHNALLAILAAEDELTFLDKENREGGTNESNMEFKIYTIPSLDPDVFPWKDFEPGRRIDYILILINPTITLDCLHSVEKMLDYVDPVFYSRKRVDFCYVKRNMDTSVVPALMSNTFCRRFKTSFQNIRVDDSDSVAYQARLCYNKAKRIIRNPLVF